ncbi:MAG: tyrosine-type recombinase/integrase [Anaerolineae bacterium]|nr:tyrosine-type recombinase/integrase [Anaerolineae bacterium]
MKQGQLPLFVVPFLEAELTPQTEFANTWALFQKRLAKEGKTEHTVNAFTSDLHLLAEYAGNHLAINGFKTSTLEDFLDWLEHGRGVPCSRKSYARRVTTLKVYFKWLADLEVLDHDPAHAILQRSGPAPLAIILNADDIFAAMLASRSFKKREEPDTRPELLFNLLLNTGIKKSEIMRLILADFERGQRPMLLIRQVSAKHEYKERRLALDADLITVLDAYLAQYAPEKQVFTCTARNLEYILEAIGVEAGIEHKLSFEMMRWTGAVRDYVGGMSPEAIREKLGLSPISWTETFLKIRKLAGENVKIGAGRGEE